MDKRPIGVLDSGVGGLTAVKALSNLLPNESIIYLGDTARVPYGTRSKDTIIKYSLQGISFLLKHNVKMIMAACGTISASLPDSVCDSFPVPYTGVLIHAVQSACALSENGRIGVIGTAAAIRSGAYGRMVRAIRPEAQVIGRACPLFVPLVENGLFDGEITKLTAKMYLESIIKEKVDTLILGCTHFPMLYNVVSEILDYSATLIDPCEETSRYISGFLTHNDMLSPPEAPVERKYFVTDLVEDFYPIAEKILGVEISKDVTHTDIENNR